MTLSIGLSTYIIRVRRKRDREMLRLDAFDGHTDFFTFATDTLRANVGQYIEVGDNRRRLQVNADIEVLGRIVEGTVDVGEYGLSSILRDEQGEMSFERQREHAEMLRLYYRAWFPQEQNFGAMALQNYGPYGCKTAMHRLLEEEFRERFPDYVFLMREAITRDQIDHYINNGAVKEFKFMQHGVPADWADAYGGEALRDNEAEIEVRIKAKRGRNLSFPDRLASFFRGGNGLGAATLFELRDFECEGFKVKLEVDGQIRTLSHSEFVRMSSRLDITDQVERDALGYPTRDTIRPLASGLLERLPERMVVRE
jgi:hypothetical protein